MTEKRFTIFGEWHKDCVIDEIRDNTGEYVTIGRVVDLLNENEQLKQTIETQNFNYDNAKSIIHDSENQIRNLKKENEQLKKDCSALICHNQNYRKENEQLKQQMQRLYNYFADWFEDRVPPSDFSEMWDFVKEDEKWD